MSKLTKKQLENRQAKVSDTSLPIAERRAAYAELMEQVMNPDDNFNPDTFDGMKDVEDYEVKKRKRAEPPERLPTMGMKPKKIMEGQMVGMFESKQDLYLLMAHYINKLLDEIDELKKIVDNQP